MSRDRFQHLKGFLGQAIARKYLECNGFEVLGEEVTVKDVSPKAKLDMVVEKDGCYRPVEVKFQEYYLEPGWFGTAFEKVIDCLAEGRGVQALLPEKNGDSRYVALDKPLLFLWYPPNGDFFEDGIERYRKAGLEIVPLESVIRSWRCEEISGSIADLLREETEKFFAAFWAKPGEPHWYPGQKSRYWKRWCNLEGKKKGEEKEKEKEKEQRLVGKSFKLRVPRKKDWPGWG